jgi:hypothetical protein
MNKTRYSLKDLKTNLVKDQIKEYDELSHITKKERDLLIVDKKNKRRSFKDLSPKVKYKDIDELIFSEMSKVKYLTLIQVSNKNLFQTFEDLPVHEIKIDKEDFYLLQKLSYYKQVENDNLSLLSKNMKYELEIKRIKQDLNSPLLGDEKKYLDYFERDKIVESEMYEEELNTKVLKEENEILKEEMEKIKSKYIILI